MLSVKRHMQHHRQALYDSLRMWRDAPFATFMTLMVIAVSLTLPVLFWLFSFNAHQLANAWRQGEHVSVYLKVGLSPVLQQVVFERIQQAPGVRQAIFISPQEGLDALQQQDGLKDASLYLQDNPLPAVIEIVPNAELDSPEKLQKMVRHLEKMAHVERVVLDMQWVSQLYAILSFVTILLQSFMFLLGLAVIMMVGNTLKFALQKRQEEIQVLKLIGATHAYIIRPFLYAGVFYGFFGALFAVFFVEIFILSLSFAWQDLSMMYPLNQLNLNFSIENMGILFVMAIALGWLGAWFSIRRLSY